MKKQMLTIVLASLLCMILPSIAFAGTDRTSGRGIDTPYAVEGGNIYFNAEKGTITDCDESVTKAVIPAEINGVAVTGVDFSLWYMNGPENAQLISITFPASVSKIDFNRKIPSLQEIKIAADNPYFTSDGLSIFNKDKTELVACKQNTSAYTIPDGVKRISIWAFGELDNLTSITVPVSLTSFSSSSITRCDNIKDVYYQGTKEQWERINYSNPSNPKSTVKFPLPEIITSANIHFNTQGDSSSGTTQTSQSGIKIMLNGSSLSFSEAPYMANGTTMVPMRIIFEALKAEVNYDAASQKITATKGDTVIELTLGQKSAKKNGQSISLDVAAVTRNGNTMVPLRFVAEALNATVDWDNASQTVSITLAE